MFKQLYTSVGAAFQSVPFPLYTFTIQLLLQSAGTQPLLTTSLQISVNHFTPTSPAAFNISAATPDGPAALPLFALPIASLTSYTDINLSSTDASSLFITSKLPILSLFQSNSSFSSCS